MDRRYKLGDDGRDSVAQRIQAWLQRHQTIKNIKNNIQNQQHVLRHQPFVRQNHDPTTLDSLPVQIIHHICTFLDLRCIGRIS